MKRIVPSEVLDVKNWLTSNSKFSESNFVGYCVERAENFQKITREEGQRLKNILMEYYLYKKLKDFGTGFKWKGSF